jgi:spore coat polysaccharide biosynthesis protein SpsF (cytidylyltransferase family)
VTANIRINAIIQARLSSTRLPRKVLQPIGGRPLLLRVVDRLRKCPSVDRIIVATTTDAGDDELAMFCRQHGLAVYRGDRDDVMIRFICAAREFHSERFLRVCSDNPFIDPALLTYQIDAAGDADYCSYVTVGGEPLSVKPLGLFAEMVTRAALERAHPLANSLMREHVTMYIFRNPSSFRIRCLALPEGIDPELRFTVDYPEDLKTCEWALAANATDSAAALMQFVCSTPSFEAAVRRIAKAHPKIYR